ncbi:MAG TPA: pantetheine-phosphate adenylyltransferase [Candidatus Krumholzibacteria bacterium]|nr:pantetheine-phosphate adenylyltransferase [Candidatus Krumholzibacteria bacterium]
MSRHVLYPGSFDPVTLGHIDILERACRLFDRVTVVVAAHGKAGMLPVDERVALFRASAAHLPGVEVHPFTGLLVDEVRARKADAVVRGIRTAGDYEHEWTLAGVNALLADGVEYVYFLARPAMAAVSSTLVRDVIRHGGPLEKLVPAPVAAALRGRTFGDG